MEPAGEMTGSKLLKTWWPGTELNRRRQPFQGCSLPNLSRCNPYPYRHSYPHFGREYWTHNGPNNQTKCGYRSSPDSDRANGKVVMGEMLDSRSFSRPGFRIRSDERFLSPDPFLRAEPGPVCGRRPPRRTGRMGGNLGGETAHEVLQAADRFLRPTAWVRC
jgi:hypothetical protein